MTRISTSVSLDPEHKEAIDNSDFGMSEIAQLAVENGLINGDVYSFVEAVGETEKEQFEEFADELQADADDLRADADDHRQKAEELEERAHALEARAERFKTQLEETSKSVKTTIDEKRDDWKDAPDAEISADEAVKSLYNHEGVVEAEVLKHGDEHKKMEVAAERADVDALKLASYAVDEIPFDDIEPKFSLSTFPPTDDWTPDWYIQPEER